MKKLIKDYIYSQQELDLILSVKFENNNYEINNIGPFVIGVFTIIIQGGQDENYIFVFDNYIGGKPYYKLIYIY